jgi:putative membrane protein
MVFAAESASEADRAFVAKVSHGGLYEVEAGKIAAMRGTAPAVENFGVLDAHDHEGVNSELEHIAAMTNVPIASGLNAEFSQRLAKLQALPASQFDALYIGDMKQIHDKDEGLFLKGTDEGSVPYQKSCSPHGGVGEGSSGMAEHPLVKFSFQEKVRAKEMMAVVTGVTLQFVLKLLSTALRSKNKMTG